MVDRPAGKTVTLWCAAGPGELAAVAGSSWRVWPTPDEGGLRATLDRARAAEIARTRHVPRDGAGYVVAFDVPEGFLDRRDVPRVEEGPPEYLISREAVGDLNRNIVGAIREYADYRGPVPDADFEAASRHFQVELPSAWRTYLQGPSWFRRGWLRDDDCHLWLYRPIETVELTEAWEPATSLHPGIALIGGSAPEQLALDLRRHAPPVVMVPLVSPGWQTAIVQAATIEEFVERGESGSFDFRYD